MSFSVKKVFSAAVLLSLALVLVLGAIAAEASEISVDLKSRAEVQNPEVLLRDVAVITGSDCALTRDLASIFITKAPKPGHKVRIRKSYLEHRIRSSGLPLDDVSLNLPEKVTVTRKSQTLNPEWVRRVFEAYLDRTEPYKSGEWELVSLKTGSPPKLPVGDLTYRSMAQPSANPAHVNLNIYLSVNGREAGRIRAAGRLNLYIRAVVAAGRLERGRKIRTEDIKPARVNISRTRKGVLTDTRSAVGLVTRRGLQAGQPILARDLIRDSAVKRGDMVTIVAESGLLRVTALGQAKQGGAVGDNIQVLNLGSKKMIITKVVGSSTVSVNF
ncbi:MAG: flagellar basal body P-ring formation chaperone FlgA [Thermodesulfobacteriota bacterium]|nr:flagellar basal body P-ring formation chaperone FlgA [Thermodesulfobacteriota bacterium]